MYKLKQKYEDFIVKEKIKLLKVKKGNYGYYLLRKRNWSTLDAIEKIASKLGINSKFIGLAGNKDKWAITEQYISIYKVDKARVENLEIKDIGLKFIGYGKDKINLGSLEGNEFDIIIRNLEEKKRLEIDKVENYFDEQRFGFKLNTHLVGKAIVKKNFKEACEILGKKTENNDYIGELRKDNRRVLRFYIHSYESWIWNKVASKYLEENYEVEKKIRIAGQELFFTKENLGKENKNLGEAFGKAFREIGKENKNIEIPIIGYLLEVKDKKIDEIYSKIMEEEGVNKEDFIIRQMPEISSPGGKRKLFLKVKNFKYEYGEDEVNKGKFKVRLRFSLGKGSYATMVVKRLFD